MRGNTCAASASLDSASAALPANRRCDERTASLSSATPDDDDDDDDEEDGDDEDEDEDRCAEAGTEEDGDESERKSAMRASTASPSGGAHSAQ